MNRTLAECARLAAPYVSGYTGDDSVAIGHMIRLASEAGHALDKGEARRLVREAAANGAAGQPRKLTVLTDVEMEQRPKPEDRIEGVLPIGAVAGLFGPPGVGKGFVVVGMQLSTATGLPWMGRDVRQAPAAYLAAEGSAGLGVRVRAWKDYHGIDGVAGVHFIPEAVSLFEPSGARLVLEALRSLPEPPGLFVVDTLARTILPGVENATEDMGAYVGALERIRDEVGCTVLAVHHTNAGGERERGNTAFRAGVDTLLSLRQEDEILRLVCEKQRESEPFDPILIQLQPHLASALALECKNAIALTASRLTPRQRECLESLALVQSGDSASNSAWMEASNTPKRTFYEVRKALEHKGFVEAVLAGRYPRWALTDAGANALECKSAIECN